MLKVFFVIFTIFTFWAIGHCPMGWGPERPFQETSDHQEVQDAIDPLPFRQTRDKLLEKIKKDEKVGILNHKLSERVITKGDHCSGV